MSSGGRFPHRQNSNGTYDSICPKCYRTIDTRNVEGDLAAEERVHICCVEDIFRHDMLARRISSLSQLLDTSE
jgi:hypothetical protein